MTTADDIVLQICLDEGLLQEAELERTREETGPEASYSDILEALIEKERLDSDALLSCLAGTFGMEIVDLPEANPSRAVLDLLTPDAVRKYRAIPLAEDGGVLEIAVCDPLNTETIDDLGHLLGRAIHARLTTSAQIDQAVQRLYGGNGEEEAVSNLLGLFRKEEAGGEGGATGAPEEGVDLESLPLNTSEEEGPIIRFVQKIIAEAYRRRASDIHLEPLEKRFRIRYRIDGVLQEIENPPKRLEPSILSRIKIMAHISIAEKRVPQDGRISIKAEGRSIDLRVSTLPTAFGESVVMRILDKEGLKLGLPQLGFFSDDQATAERLVGYPDGIFLVTGPTGSGKSTTLYAALNTMNKPDRKIITVEDPVEYEIPGINQVQVRQEVGMTFAAALRSMLRQAPNIIMVGEIRDKETAEIALNASLTGHMVYSTLHTNDAPSAVSRLVNIGIKPFLISASLRGVLAQRLVRQIDPEHWEPYTPTESELSLMGMYPDQATSGSFRRGIGHPSNGGTGFRGRKGIFEILVVDEAIERLIYEDASLVELRNKARELGMRTLREDGIRKVQAGVTSLQEVLNVTVETRG